MSAPAMHTLQIAAVLVVSLNPLRAQCVLPTDSTAVALIQSGLSLIHI